MINSKNFIKKEGEVSSAIKVLKPRNRIKNNNTNINKESFLEIYNDDNSVDNFENNQYEEEELNFIQRKSKKNNIIKTKEVFLEKKINELKDFNKLEKNYSKKLDDILFKNIEESRLIYKKIQLFGDLLVDAVKSKTLCDKDVDELKEENLMLKAVIARSQVNKKMKLKSDNDNIPDRNKRNSLDINLNRNNLKK